MPMSCLFIYFAVQPHSGTGDYDNQLGSSFLNDFVVPGGNHFLSNLCIVKSVAHQQHL